MTDMSAAGPIDRLRALDVCCICDAMEALGLDGVVDGIGPMWEGATAIGPAVTTRLAPGPAPAGAPPVHLGARAIEAARPGDVLVVDNGARDQMGSWGGLLSEAAKLAGVAGVVTSGACRDIDEARQMCFPVFAQGPAVRTARGRVHEISCGEPVRLGSATVRPGDIVAADGSGVVVIPAGHLARVTDKAAEIARREHLMKVQLRAGVAVSVVLGSSYEEMLQRPATDIA